jgi:hypothetical protein
MAVTESGEGKDLADERESTSEVESQSTHSADTPIHDPAKDELGRAPFASALASDILRAPRDSGFVIALTGPWGAGKTSVLRLIEREISDEVTATISFNPWLFSGTEQLVEHFFGELAGQLEATGSKQLDKLSTALRGYGRVVSPVRYLPYVGEIARATSEAATDLSTALSGEQATSAKSKAADLKERLTPLPRPILVMVDDLDRLRPEEIVDVVRLVRLVGDFPNLVYVLAFDLIQVESALGSSREEGRAYLDKIVHISHTLPPVRPEDLTAVLTSALSRVIPEPAAYRFAQERYVEVFWSDVRPLFSTVRDVRRFANVLPTTLALLGDEVDLTDILALEALRLFEPESFEGIVAARYVLTGTLSPVGGIDVEQLLNRDSEEDKTLVAKIPAVAPRRPKQVQKILGQLFPLSETQFGGSRKSMLTAEWKRERRVADLEVLETYLHRRLAPGVIPAREVEEALAALADRERLQELFSTLDDRELADLYGRLADFEGAFPDSAPEIAIELIMAKGVGLGGGFQDISGSVLITRMLRPLKPERVKQVLDQLHYPNLSRRYGILRTVAYREDSGRMVSEEDAAELTHQLIEATLASSAAELAGEEDLGPLILLLHREAYEELETRLPDWLANDRFFVELVYAHRLVAVRGTEADGSTKTVSQLTWPALLELVDLETLRLRIEEIDPDWVEGEFGRDRFLIWDQARFYADSPAAGNEEAERWPDV